MVVLKGVYSSWWGKMDVFVWKYLRGVLTFRPPNFNFLGKPLLGEKYVEGRRRKKEERTIMPSLVATTSTPARKPFVRTHYVRTKNNVRVYQEEYEHKQ